MLELIDSELVQALSGLKDAVAPWNAPLARHVESWAGDPEPSPDEDELFREFESMGSAVLVALPVSEGATVTGRTGSVESLEVVSVLFLYNQASQRHTLHGDARRPGMYALAAGVRRVLDNRKIEAAGGALLRFESRRHVGYTAGRLVWALRYRLGDIRTRNDPDATAEFYARIVAHVNHEEPGAAEAPVSFERTFS